MWRLPLLIRNRNHMSYCYTKESPCKTFFNQALSSCSCISMSRWCSSSSSSEMRQFDDFENGPDDAQPSQNLQSHPISTATDNLSSHKKYTKSWSVLPIWSQLACFKQKFRQEFQLFAPTSWRLVFSCCLSSLSHSTCELINIQSCQGISGTSFLMVAAFQGGSDADSNRALASPRCLLASARRFLSSRSKRRFSACALAVDKSASHREIRGISAICS